MYSLVQAWAWGKEQGDLSDRGASPWDSERRRPSHQDRLTAGRTASLKWRVA